MANGPITHKIPKLSWKNRGDKVTGSLINTLNDVIAALESALVNVDNCGNCNPSNCCQSQTCQSTSCQGCQTCQRQACQSISCQSCQWCQDECKW